MQKLEFANTEKNPNECHQVLLDASIIVLDFSHDRVYDDNGVVEVEATTFCITVPDEQVEQTQTLVNQFLAA